MKKTLYIIPGYEETYTMEQYSKIKTFAEEKGYSVVGKDIDWKKSLSKQMFEVTKNDVVFGFSLGAILAWFIAQKYPCEHLILASMSPHYSFEKDRKDWIEMFNKEYIDDIVRNLKKTTKAGKQTTLYGELEKEPADIIVPKTEHELNYNYIKEIKGLL